MLGRGGVFSRPKVAAAGAGLQGGRVSYECTGHIVEVRACSPRRRLAVLKAGQNLRLRVEEVPTYECTGGPSFIGRLGGLYRPNVAAAGLKREGMTPL